MEPYYFLIAFSPFLLIIFSYWFTKEKKKTKTPQGFTPPMIVDKHFEKNHLFYSESMLKSREHIRFFIQSLNNNLLSASWRGVEQLISAIESDDEYVEQIKKHRLNETLLQDVEKLLTVYVRMDTDRQQNKQEETNRVILHIASILEELRMNIEDKKEDEFNRLHELIFVREN